MSKLVSDLKELLGRMESEVSVTLNETGVVEKDDKEDDPEPEEEKPEEEEEPEKGKDSKEEKPEVADKPAKGYDIGKFFKEGKAKEKGLDIQNIDPQQLSMGIEVEYEHTSDEAVAGKIAKDHLAEIPDYYTRLAEMEKGALQKSVEEPSAEGEPSAEPEFAPEPEGGEFDLGMESKKSVAEVTLNELSRIARKS